MQDFRHKRRSGYSALGGRLCAGEYMIISNEMKNLEDWHCKSPPKDRDSQWEDDYSSKEFAKKNT